MKLQETNEIQDQKISKLVILFCAFLFVARYLDTLTLIEIPKVVEYSNYELANALWCLQILIMIEILYMCRVAVSNTLIKNYRRLYTWYSKRKELKQ